MQNVLGQLNRWRSVERLIRLAWGAGRWVAVVGAVLAFACLTDWLADRYLGSESWRAVLKKTWVFAPRQAATADERWFTEHLRLHYHLRVPDPPVVDETPKWLRVGMTGAQVLLAAALAYAFVVRPWRRTPRIDDLAAHAEEEVPEFGHRLVTAVQLNRPGAKTAGMSKALIAEVAREAGEIASRHNLLGLVNYSRLALAAAVALPVVALWGGFVAARPELAGVLLQRQMLLGVEIPRTIHLKNRSQEVWPTGSEVEVRYEVTGDYDPAMVGRVRVEPDGQPEEYYDLTYAGDSDGGAIFAAKLPRSSSDFDFTARLGGGRTRGAGRIRFEAPPTTTEIESWQLLPRFLGTRDGKPGGPPYERQNDGAKRGEVVDALPLSEVRIGAAFTKPIRAARLVPVERGDGVRERDLAPLAPLATSGDRLAAEWRFPTTPRMIGYRIELTDDRGFRNSVPVRRNIRMAEDRPPAVTFMPESLRHPDPANVYEGDLKEKARFELGDKMPLTPDGRVMVIYHAQSPQGVSRANVRYRVIPKGVDLAAYPKEFQDIQHPREDPENRVFSRLTLKPVTADLNVVGPFVPDLGLFQRSWQGLSELDRDRVNVEFYSFPSPDPANVPSALEAGGRYNFEVAALQKRMPDGSLAKLELGDTVELFVEVFDKNPSPGPDGKPRPAGYTREARRKIVVTQEDARYAFRMWKEQNKRLQEKIRELTTDQENVFKKPDEEPEPEPEPKKK
jgi:hypothetical protein